MLKLIDGILQQFRICFKREETFGTVYMSHIHSYLECTKNGVRLSYLQVVQEQFWIAKFNSCFDIAEKMFQYIKRCDSIL